MKLESQSNRLGVALLPLRSAMAEHGWRSLVAYGPLSTVYCPQNRQGAPKGCYIIAQGATQGTMAGGLQALAYNQRSTAYRLQSGFSLIEVTLAMLVLAVGILGILVLFPAGLQQNERAIADTHAAFLAEEVFGGLRARAETNWNNLGALTVPIAATGALWNLVQRVSFTNYSTVLTNRYTNTASSLEDHALRYRLVMTGTNGLTKNATLWVWPGEFGTTNDPSVFYMEFFRFRP